MELEIRKLLEEKLKDVNVYIDEVSYEKEGTNYFLRIVIDSEEIVDLDKCVEVTNIISPILDDADIIKESYILDICSKERGDINEI